MKIVDFSKKSSIHHESDLISRFHEMLRQDRELSWRVPSENSSGGRDTVALEMDGHQFTFRPVYKLNPGTQDLEALSAGQNPPPLLVAPRLSKRVLEGCREYHIAAMDLNGQSWLRAPGLLVAHGPEPGRSFHAGLEPVDFFADKSARIIRRLLTDRDRIWTQREIVPRTGVSAGLVSRIVRHLQDQGFIEKTGSRSFHLKHPLALLDAWADSDRMARRTRTVSCAGFLGSPLELARQLQTWAANSGAPIAFTQWTAAWARHPFTEPVICSAYVRQLPDVRDLEQLGLRIVGDGGKLQLHVPGDGGIFTETRMEGGLVLTTDAQIYLDLQRTGLRGPEAAAALREWEGFCRP